MEVVELGLQNYSEVYELQKAYVRQIASGERENTLFLVEHPPVYTVGRKNKLNLGVLPYPIFEIERGGETTYHEPGQWIAYPLFFLKEKHQRDLHQFLRNLESVVIDLLAEFGLESQRKPGATGVWVRNQTRKIASLGIAVSRWVTYHGLALNVNNSLEGFQFISPCGFSADVMTSVKSEIGHSISLKELSLRGINLFQKHFSEF